MPPQARFGCLRTQRVDGRLTMVRSGCRMSRSLSDVTPPSSSPGVVFAWPTTRRSCTVARRSHSLDVAWPPEGTGLPMATAVAAPAPSRSARARRDHHGAVRGGQSVGGLGTGWGFPVYDAVHRVCSRVEGIRAQAVNGVWATLRRSCRHGWSATFPRRGQPVGGVGGKLGKNGGPRGRSPYPGCVQELSTGCGFCARPYGRVDAGGAGRQSGARTAEDLVVLGIFLWARPPGMPGHRPRRVCAEDVHILWITCPGVEGARFAARDEGGEVACWPVHGPRHPAE